MTKGYPVCYARPSLPVIYSHLHCLFCSHILNEPLSVLFNQVYNRIAQVIDSAEDYDGQSLNLRSTIFSIQSMVLVCYTRDQRANVLCFVFPSPNNNVQMVPMAQFCFVSRGTLLALTTKRPALVAGETSSPTLAIHPSSRCSALSSNAYTLLFCYVAVPTTATMPPCALNPKLSMEPTTVSESHETFLSLSNKSSLGSLTAIYGLSVA